MFVCVGVGVGVWHVCVACVCVGGWVVVCVCVGGWVCMGGCWWVCVGVCVGCV